ncbi:MAG TPA: uracil-DNA glycosylase, partial [Gemmatimonadaceae bacterium]|nr:uracil-DNA glycosylase [Gemmatimonadaceae bacterium]
PAAPDVARERPVTAADLDWRSTLASSGNKPLSSGEPTPRDPAPSERGGHEHPDTEPAAPASNAAPSTRGVAAPSGLVVNADEGELFGGPISRASSLEEIAAMIETCTRCPLYKTATHAVPGEGNPHAELMCVGEAPGATEDETGRPFVGAAGQLLTKILAAINLKREDVYITNVLKHRPPGNRNPMPDEVTACRPYLVRQIELIRPKVILAFGTFAAQSLLDTKLALGKLRGAVHRYHGIPVVVTYHPAALLRNPAWKRPTWEDVQLARRILDNASA